MPKIKALGLFSGGLDSILAIKLVERQGIGVIAVSFVSAFFGEKKSLLASAKKLGVRLKVVDVTLDFLNVLRNPRYGYGRNMNPCIDCKIFMLKKARQYAKKIGAKFIFTGEVLGERPMSQNKPALELIAKRAGLEGKLLRPLSAKLLPETEAENKGFINREKLLDIHGRGRNMQMQLAKDFGIKEYPQPAGGCLLTMEHKAAMVKDLLAGKKRISANDLHLVKFGRHYRFGSNKIIVGRNHKDNLALRKWRNSDDYVFEPVKVMGPLTLLQGKKTSEMIGKAAALTVRYSDGEGKAAVRYGSAKLDKRIFALPMCDAEVETHRIAVVRKPFK